MRFEKKLVSYTQREIWEEYCSFLDLSIEEYMEIQNRLLLEQIELMSKCELGQKIFKGKKLIMDRRTYEKKYAFRSCRCFRNMENILCIIYGASV